MSTKEPIVIWICRKDLGKGVLNCPSQLTKWNKKDKYCVEVFFENDYTPQLTISTGLLVPVDELEIVEWRVIDI